MGKKLLLVYFKELLSTRYGARNLGPMGEEDRQDPCLFGAYHLVGK